MGGVFPAQETTHTHKKKSLNIRMNKKKKTLDAIYWPQQRSQVACHVYIIHITHIYLISPTIGEITHT